MITSFSVSKNNYNLGFQNKYQQNAILNTLYITEYITGHPIQTTNIFFKASIFLADFTQCSIEFHILESKNRNF